VSDNVDFSDLTMLALSGTVLAQVALNPAEPGFAGQSAGAKKRVIVIGGGIAGLSCAYELERRKHDAIVLEASGRTGGHVRTQHDGFADGLYADLGAEHFYYPGYTEYWRYLKEFSLTAIPYPRRNDMVRFLNGEQFSEQDLHGRKTLAKLEFNQREINFLTQRSWAELPLLYLQPYVDKIGDENNPFEPGLSELDELSTGALLKREGASPAALRFFGGPGSALQTIWAASIKKLRGTDLESKKLFRIKGGNQLITDAFAARLGNRIHLGCPVLGIEHSASGASVRCREFGQERTYDADFVVSCISAVVLRQIPVSPAWPDAKSFVIREMPYYTRTRIVFQSRTRFWETDKISPNWTPPNPQLNELWSMAEEVNTPRGILLGGAQPGVSAATSLEAFHKLYPGKSADIEQVVVHDWSRDPFAGMCERTAYRPGELSRFWPEVTRPFGRIHFAGAYAASMSWGQEAALESGNRAAREIDHA
jgi:monoamine oxidase